MKKLTTIIAGLFLYFSASAFSGTDANVSAKIKSVFEKEFISASEIKWTKKNDLYIASFKENDTYLTAAYSEEGELLSIGRYIEMSKLPLKVLRELQNKYSSYIIDPTVIELSTDETSYFIYAENEKFKVKIKSDASGNLKVESRARK
jgi:hypothetical protein